MKRQVTLYSNTNSHFSSFALTTIKKRNGRSQCQVYAVNAAGRVAKDIFDAAYKTCIEIKYWCTPTIYNRAAGHAEIGVNQNLLRLFYWATDCKIFIRCYLNMWGKFLSLPLAIVLDCWVLCFYEIREWTTLTR